MLRRVFGLDAAPGPTAFAVGLGVAIGLLPIAPLQTLAAVGLAFALRLNRLAVFAGTLIWQPFTAPFILGAEFAVGRFLVGKWLPQAGGGPAGNALASLAAGASALAVAGGAAAGLASYAWLRGSERRRLDKNRTHPSTVEGPE